MMSLKVIMKQNFYNACTRCGKKVIEGYSTNHTSNSQKTHMIYVTDFHRLQEILAMDFSFGN